MFALHVWREGQEGFRWCVYRSLAEAHRMGGRLVRASIVDGYLVESLSN